MSKPTSAAGAPGPSGGRGNLPIGIIVLDKHKQERVVQLIADGTALPTTVKVRFSYAYDGMKAVRVQLTLGEGLRPDQVHVLGKLDLDGLPPRPRGTPIQVELEHLGDRIVLRIRDPDTGSERTAEIALPT